MKTKKMALRQAANFVISDSMERREAALEILRQNRPGSGGGGAHQAKLVSIYKRWLCSPGLPLEDLLKELPYEWQKDALKIMIRGDRLRGHPLHKGFSQRFEHAEMRISIRPSVVADIDGQRVAIHFWVFQDRRRADVVGQYMADFGQAICDNAGREVRFMVVDVFDGKFYVSKPHNAEPMAILKATCESVRRLLIKVSGESA